MIGTELSCGLDPVDYEPTAAMLACSQLPVGLGGPLGRPLQRIGQRAAPIGVTASPTTSTKRRRRLQRAAIRHAQRASAGVMALLRDSLPWSQGLSPPPGLPPPGKWESPAEHLLQYLVDAPVKCDAAMERIAALCQEESQIKHNDDLTQGPLEDMAPYSTKELGEHHACTSATAEDMITATDDLAVPAKALEDTEATFAHTQADCMTIATPHDVSEVDRREEFDTLTMAKQALLEASSAVVEEASQMKHDHALTQGSLEDMASYNAGTYAMEEDTNTAAADLAVPTEAFEETAATFAHTQADCMATATAHDAPEADHQDEFKTLTMAKQGLLEASSTVVEVESPTQQHHATPKEPLEDEVSHNIQKLQVEQVPDACDSSVGPLQLFTMSTWDDAEALSSTCRATARLLRHPACFAEPHMRYEGCHVDIAKALEMCGGDEEAESLALAVF